MFLNGIANTAEHLISCSNRLIKAVGNCGVSDALLFGMGLQAIGPKPVPT
jgi:hypothetical protein